VPFGVLRPRGSSTGCFCSAVVLCGGPAFGAWASTRWSRIRPSRSRQQVRSFFIATPPYAGSTDRETMSAPGSRLRASGRLVAAAESEDARHRLSAKRSNHSYRSLEPGAFFGNLLECLAAGLRHAEGMRLPGTFVQVQSARLQIAALSIVCNAADHVVQPPADVAEV
jgi:hypothetical protein